MELMYIHLQNIGKGTQVWENYKPITSISIRRYLKKKKEISIFTGSQFSISKISGLDYMVFKVPFVSYSLFSLGTSFTYASLIANKN